MKLRVAKKVWLNPYGRRKSTLTRAYMKWLKQPEPRFGQWLADFYDRHYGGFVHSINLENIDGN